MTMLYWYCDDPKRKLETDIVWARHRFQTRFGKNPATVLVRPDEADKFEGFGLRVVVDSAINPRHFGLEG